MTVRAATIRICNGNGTTNLSAMKQPRSPSKDSNPAFTLTELLVVIACVAMLALLALPALANNHTHSTRQGCLANLRRLQLAAEMYRLENNDTLMPNSPAGGVGIGWIGSGTAEGWGMNLGNTNVAQYKTNLIGTYLCGNVSVLRCPGDIVPSANGFRIRSYSLNGQMGALYYGPVGPPYNPGYRTYIKGSDLICPTPANAFVFADESPATINDGFLQIDSNTPRFPDVPAAYLDGGCGFSFADGHAEIHQWQTTALAIPVRFGFVVGGTTFAGAQNVDWLWVKEHAACPQ